MSSTVPAGKFLGVHHLHFWVGNALQASAFYCARFGFERAAYRGLETGYRSAATHVIKQNNIMLAFSSPFSQENKEMASHLVMHGDGVRDIAFSVDNVRAIYDAAIARGAVGIMPPTESGDKFGKVVMAVLKTYGDTVHTLIENKDYTGPFLPGFIATDKPDPLSKITGPVGLKLIDHVVGNQNWNEMETAANWYIEKLGFKRFWSVDDKQIHTEYSALKSIVVIDADHKITMPLNEPAKAQKISQIEEYVKYYGGAGVQHIALFTEDIISTIKALRARGVEFLTVPSKYYDNLRQKLAQSSTVKVAEDINAIQELNILVDMDEQGYLLQIFTKNMEDRPTLFFEIIERRNNQGFGLGNFKALFESIERDQEKRGNL